MSQPIYVSSPQTYPVGSYPAGMMAGPARQAINPPYSPTLPASPSVGPSMNRSPNAPVAQTTNPRPIFRAKGPDEPTPATTRPALTMPTPEQLGVARARISDISEGIQAEVRGRLEQLGAVSFPVEKLETGGCRFTCFLPTRQPGLTHRIDTEATTAAEAVNLGLHRAEQWALSVK
jgi:hypothetical protein